MVPELQKCVLTRIPCHFSDLQSSTGDKIAIWEELKLAGFQRVLCSVVSLCNLLTVCYDELVPRETVRNSADVVEARLKYVMDGGRSYFPSYHTCLGPSVIYITKIQKLSVCLSVCAWCTF